MASIGNQRQFQVRSSKRTGIEADQSLIDRSCGKIELTLDTELHDSRWARFNEEGDGDQATHYEKNRIFKLADEREKVQKKTFTKWVNSHLQRVHSKMEDLYKDCRDGRNLLVLLEVLSGEKLPKAARGRMRIHCLENNEKVLSFLRLKKVKLENLGPADITDGNHRLTLGLIWTIILRFQIQEIDFIDENKERRSAKDALLLWCQMKTADYDNCNVTNFTTSWRNGLAFNAIIHKHLPHLIDYRSLKGEDDRIATLDNAFNVADEKCGLAKLLDAEDISADHPDEKSIITYLATYYHYFSKLKQQQLEGKRIGGVLDNFLNIDGLENQYDTLASDLLKWIELKINEMNDNNFQNSLSGLQVQWKEFEEYRKIEKPPKIDERGNLEILLFDLVTKLRAANRKAYKPKEGQLVSDINNKWAILEESEYSREVKLREEIRKQELLERTAAKFISKVDIRSSWIEENTKLVTDDDFGNTLGTITAGLLKQNALDNEIQAYGERVTDMTKLTTFLAEENYYEIARLDALKDDVLSNWTTLQALNEERRDKLLELKDLYELLAQCDEEEQELDEIKLGLERESELVGLHLLECDELIAKHQLVLIDLESHQQTIHKLSNHKKASDPQVASQLDHLQNLIYQITEMANARSAKLDQSKQLHTFYEEVDDHDEFIKLQATVISNMKIGTDLSDVTNQLDQFNEIKETIDAREASLVTTIDEGRKLISANHYASPTIQDRVNSLTRDWDDLEQTSSFTKKQLDNHKNLYQTLADVDALSQQVHSKTMAVQSIDVADPYLAISVGKLSAQGVKLAQIKSDYTDNIVGKKLPKLKERVDNCNSDMTNRALDELVLSLEDFDNVYKQKHSDLSKNKKLAKDLALCSSTQEWCDEKLAVLEQLKIPDDIDQVDLVRRRVNLWEDEIDQHAPIIGKLQTIPEKYQDEAKNMLENRVVAVMSSWERLASAIQELKQKLSSKQSALEFGMNCQEAISSIDEKKRLAEKIAELEGNSKDMDINSVMAVQKKLGKLERDRDALKQRMKELEQQGAELAEKHPERAAEIQKKLDAMRENLDKLNAVISDKRAGLGAAGALHSFLGDLADLEDWVQMSSTTLDDAPAPTTQQHAVQLQNIHDSLKAEIDSYEPNVTRLCKTGREMVKDRPDEDAMIARLEQLQADFNNLSDNCADRSKFLEDKSIELSFNREANNLDQALDNKELLMKSQLDNLPVYVQEADASVKNHDTLLKTLDAMKPRCEKLQHDAQAYDIDARPDMIERANEVMDKYADTCELGKQAKTALGYNVTFARWNIDCAHFGDWLKERRAILREHDEMTETGSVVADSVNTGMSANDGLDLHRAFQKHRAFTEELKHNEDKLNTLDTNGDDLKIKLPDKVEDISDKISELKRYWTELRKACADREMRLFESSRAELISKNVNELDHFANLVGNKFSSKPLSDDDLDNLATIKRLLKDQGLDEAAMDFRKQELDGTAERLAVELSGEELQEMEDKVAQLRKRFDELEGPMSERRKQLEAAKALHELGRDISIELRWVEEKLQNASLTNYGDTLHMAQSLASRHETLKNEVKSHEPAITELLTQENDEAMTTPQEKLKASWDKLDSAIISRSERLALSVQAQRYLFDADEVDDWLTERELYLLGQENQIADNEDVARRMIRRHNQQQAAIQDYSSKIDNMADKCNAIIDQNNPDADKCQAEQSKLETNYANLKQLAKDREAALQEKRDRLKLRQEFDQFQNWIAEREQFANLNDTGKNTAHCERLLDRFDGWASETQALGNDKLAGCQTSADKVITNQPNAQIDIVEWKSSADSSFQELLEGIRTRKEILIAAHKLHKCLRDCADLTNRLGAKKSALPKESGHEVERTKQLERQHEADVTESSVLINQAKNIDDDAQKLAERYAGEESLKIASYRTNLNDAVNSLERALTQRAVKLKQVGATHDFSSLATELLEWIEEKNKQIDAQQRPQDKTQVNQLISDHADIRADMESREPDFQKVYKIEQNQELDDESWQKVNALIKQLKDGYSQLDSKWNARNSYLLLAADVTGFWRDCAHADAWLKSAEKESFDENPVDAKQALLELEQYESNIVAPWNEKFKLLEKLTEYEMLEQSKVKAEQERQTSEDKLKELAKREREIAPPETHTEERRQSKRKTSASSHHSKSPMASSKSPSMPTEQRQSKSKAPKPPKTKIPPSENLPSNSLSNIEASPRNSATVMSETSSRTEKDFPKSTSTTDHGTSPLDASHSANLNRKQEHGPSGKKAANRSWNTLFCVLSGGRLLFFKDNVTAGKASAAAGGQYTGKQTWKGEPPLDLRGSIVEIATDYKKRSNVFRLTLGTGGEYLFQGSSPEDMNIWVDKLRSYGSDSISTSSSVNNDKKGKSMFRFKK